MSILIKGMEIPSCCDGCGFSSWSNLHQTVSCQLCDYAPCFADHSREYEDKRADFCTLVEVPEPHGRLIDADKMNDLLLKEKERVIGSGDKLGAFAVGFAMGFIHKEPTVIEGSEDA